MTKINELLRERNIPELLRTKRGKLVKTPADYQRRREEIKQLLEEKEYGFIPPNPEHVRVRIVSEDMSFSAGRAPLRKLEVICTLDGAEFSFPACSVIPKDKTNIPAFIHINFAQEVPHKYLPAEEICDRGFAVFSFCMNDVSPDMSGDFKANCGKHLLKNRRRDSASGKIAIWAWAAMRLMDYVQTLDFIDKENVAVIGHSRLGKAALVAGGFDERFKFVISNDSGCCGAAISRGGIGETIDVITNVFPFWFCPGFNKNAPNYESLGIDQNLLLGLTVPRHLMIGSAELDSWADPESEFLCLASLNSAYAIFGKRGLVHSDAVPTAPAVLSEGEAHYHVRCGGHYLSREDWNYYMDYIEKQGN